MKAQAILAALAVGGGLGIGWLTAPAPEADANAAGGDVAALARAGEDAGQAAERLRRLGLAPVAEAEPAAPPPPDIALLFRRDLTAIEERANGRLVWIIDNTQPFGRRALRVGDVYQDGWRVRRIQPQMVELRRRREVRRVEAFAAPPVLEP